MSKSSQKFHKRSTMILQNRHSMKTLTADDQLYTAKMEAKPIFIYFNKKLYGRGVIERITEDSIKVKGEYYMRGVCEFKFEG